MTVQAHHRDLPTGNSNNSSDTGTITQNGQKKIPVTNQMIAHAQQKITHRVRQIPLEGRRSFINTTPVALDATPGSRPFSGTPTPDKRASRRAQARAGAPSSPRLAGPCETRRSGPHGSEPACPELPNRTGRALGGGLLSRFRGRCTCCQRAAEILRQRLAVVPLRLPPPCGLKLCPDCRMVL